MFFLANVLISSNASAQWDQKFLHIRNTSDGPILVFVRPNTILAPWQSLGEVKAFETKQFAYSGPGQFDIVFKQADGLETTYLGLNLDSFISACRLTNGVYEDFLIGGALIPVTIDANRNTVADTSSPIFGQPVRTLVHSNWNLVVIPFARLRNNPPKANGEPPAQQNFSP